MSRSLHLQTCQLTCKQKFLFTMNTKSEVFLIKKNEDTTGQQVRPESLKWCRFLPQWIVLQLTPTEEQRLHWLCGLPSQTCWSQKNLKGPLSWSSSNLCSWERMAAPNRKSLWAEELLAEPRQMAAWLRVPWELRSPHLSPLGLRLLSRCAQQAVGRCWGNRSLKQARKMETHLWGLDGRKASRPK